MEDSSMINMPDLVYDEKVGNKRVRDNEEENPKGRLEKRPSGILGVNGGGDHVVDRGDEANNGDNGGGIMDTLFANVFHKNTSGTQGEMEAHVVQDEDKREDLGGLDGGNDGGDGGGEGGEGGGIISSFFSNIFHNNGSVDEDASEQTISNHVHEEVVAKTKCLGGGDGERGGGDGEPVDLSAKKLPEKKVEGHDLPCKDHTGPTSNLKPDDYAERVFFLNNN